MIGFQQTQDSVVEADTGRINRLLLTNALELKTWMIRVFLPKGIGLISLLLNGCGKII
jgi:hypothetical protein